MRGRCLAAADGDVVETPAVKLRRVLGVNDEVSVGGVVALPVAAAKVVLDAASEVRFALGGPGAGSLEER